MAAGFAFGAGFVGGALERQKEIRDERRENRKLGMEVWLKDTLPRVRAAQAKDDAAVNNMNTLMADSYYKGNPALAFYATKWMGSTGKDEAAFREHVATNAVPEEVKAAQLAEMQKHFNFDGNAFSWKSQAPAAAPAQGQQGQRPSFWDRMMGKGNPAQDAQAGAAQVAGAAGVDANAATTPRFDSINVPGGFESKDPEKERLRDLGLQAAMKNPDMIRNYGDFVSALSSGDRAKVDAMITSPKFTVSREEAKQDQFNQAFRMGAMEGYLKGDFGKDNDLMRAIIRGDSTRIIEGVTKGMKTDEEKLAQSAKLRAIEVATGSLDSPEAFLMMRRSGLLDQLDIPEANLALMEAQAEKSIKDKQDWQTQLMLAENNKGKPADQQVTMDDVEAAGKATEAPPPEAPKTKEQVILDAMYEDEGLVLRPKAPEAPPPKADIPRAGTVVQFGTDDDIRNFPDPVSLLKNAATRTKSKLKQEENKLRMAHVAKNITVPPQVFARINEDEDYGKEWTELLNQYIEPNLQEFGSLADAQAVVHPFGLAKVRGNIVVVPPKRD